MFWTWGLSDEHDSSPYGANIENTDLQQFTVNMFADMGIQPAVTDAILATRGLVRASASSDTVAATTTLTDLPEGISTLVPVTITGSASDTGGVVGVVEVSLDGGATWKVADGKGDWSYTWVPRTPGTYEVVARAIDDSLNLPSTNSLATQTVEVTGPVVPSALSLFDPLFVPVTGLLLADGPYELGLRFSAAENGNITELKYWRAEGDAGDTDIREGSLWSANGNLLASVTFESAPGESGWQTAALDIPVQIEANTEYTVSYGTEDNYFAATGFFGEDYSEPFGILNAPSSQNGVYAIGNNGVFPTLTFQGENYWVDVSFEPGELQPVGVAAAAGGFDSSLMNSNPTKGENIIGSPGADTILGTARDDTLKGRGGDDTLRGFDGSDRVAGGRGDDILVSGAGELDILRGGPGADVFVFGDELDNGVQEKDVVKGFNPLEDTIDLGGYRINSYVEIANSLLLMAGPDGDEILLRRVCDVDRTVLLDDLDNWINPGSHEETEFALQPEWLA